MQVLEPVHLSPVTAITALSSALIVGIVSGVGPAHEAADLDPIEALRSE
jgi:ABC-type antimicrobial peptide transport system permease subunit